MRFLVARGIACAAGESLTTTETVVSERPRWSARVRKVTFPFLSVVLLLVKGNFQALLKIAEGVSHLNLALSKGDTFPGFKLCDAKARVPHRKAFLGDESRV
jgi:hypothetical protein